MVNEDKIDRLYGETLQMVESLADKYTAMEIAAVFVNLGMTLYKTCLTEQDYQKMAAAIYETRGMVKPFKADEEITLQ